jgi:peptidoglycan/xylan/chitin deacetylase (PgdA/CDA1 family)
MGCEVIGHSWDHKNLAKLPAEDVRKQLMETNSTIEAVTGVAPTMFRPPYGAVSDTMKSVAEELGLAIINWNVDPEDWNTKDADAVYNAVMEQVKDRAIILSHEIYGSTLEAYTRLIPELLSQGYQIVTVSELLFYTHGRLTPGQVYYNG